MKDVNVTLNEAGYVNTGVIYILPRISSVGNTSHQRHGMDDCVNVHVAYMMYVITRNSQSTSRSQPSKHKNIFITFVQCWTNVEEVGPTMYKCYENVFVCWVSVKLGNFDFATLY